MSQRKQNLKGKESSGTPTKVANPSPSRHPIRSPLTASKFNASNTKPSVSYGQLQIVLENIQEIRRKANLQIAQLTTDNQKLRLELTRSHQDFEELANRLNRSTSKNDYEIKVIEQLDAAENDKKALEVELKEREKCILELERRNEDLQRKIQEKEDDIRQLEERIEQENSKWKWAFDILAGDAQRSQQLIWKVKNQYSEGIWSIFEENSTFNQQLHLKTGRLEVLERELAEIKQYSKQTASLLEKSMAETTAINNKLAQQEQELSAIRQKYILAENDIASMSKDFTLQKSEYESIIARLQARIAQVTKQKEVGMRDLATKTTRLQQQIHQKELQMLQKQKHEEYEAMISQICEESQDYSHLLERLRYLEKFKSEHYFNVEKIQYLCKMLDY